MRIIKILTDKDAKSFNRAAPKHEIVMAGFFMVNCPACEAFKPEWDKFVNSCESEEDPNVLIAEIDSDQASRVNFDTSALEGFPTVYRDVKGEEGVVEFKHERTKKALRRFLKEAMAAKGGAKKRTRSKKRRKKGGYNSWCWMRYENRSQKTQQEADQYCLEMDKDTPKCNVNTGQCIKPSGGNILRDLQVRPEAKANRRVRVRLRALSAAAGGYKKRKTKRRKTKRKSRRKKKKGGDQSHCVQASRRVPTKSQEQGDAYCTEYYSKKEDGEKIKCDINTGRCIKPLLPPAIPLRRRITLRSSSYPPSGTATAV